ncbi:MAG: hypothetical protein AAGA90_00750 [Actinomycetota bacterium]
MPDDGVEIRLGPVNHLHALAQLRFSLSLLSVDLILLPTEKFEIDRSRSECFERLLGSTVQLCDTGSLPCGRTLGLSTEAVEVTHEALVQVRGSLLAQLDIDVVLSDLRLDETHREVRKLTSVSLLPPSTEEVLVLASPPSHDRVGELALALGAEHRAAQVVLMNPSAASTALAIEQVLNLLEQLQADQLLVQARILGTTPTDETYVVRVLQHTVHSAATYRSTCGVLARLPHREALLVDELGDLGQGVVAGRVLLEHLDDERRSFLIDFDDRHIWNALHPYPSVEIAERRLTGRASDRGLALHLECDILGQVVAVVLVDARLDVRHQPALRRAGVGVDALHVVDGHAVAFEVLSDPARVDGVSCESIGLVDDDVVDVLFGNSLEETLQGLSFFHVARALARFVELFDDLSVESLGGELALGALHWQRQSFLTRAGSAQLAGGRDAYVGDGA